MVASISTAVAMPTPRIFRSISDSVANAENTATMISAALVTTPALLATPPAGAAYDYTGNGTLAGQRGNRPGKILACNDTDAGSSHAVDQGCPEGGLSARDAARLRGHGGRPGRRAGRPAVRRGVHQERCAGLVAQSELARPQTLVLFMISAITAVLLVAPQSELALGAELLAVSAVSAAALLTLDRRAGHDPGSSVACYIERASPNLVTAVLVGIAGFSFLLKAGGGLYWMIPAVLASLVGGVINAWLFLLKVDG